LGIDERPIITERADAQSYGKQETFDEDTTDEEFVRRILRGMADHLMAKVRADGKTIRCVEVRMRYNDMEQSRRSESLDEPTDLETDVYALIDRLAKRAWDRRVSLRLVGLKLSRVYDGGGWHQAGLDLPGTGYDQEIRRELARVMDEARVKYGSGSVMRAHQLSEKGRIETKVEAASCRLFSRVKRQDAASTLLNTKSCFSFMD
jgi:DNA polymerase-4